MEIRGSVHYMALFDDGASVIDSYSKLRCYDTDTGAEVSRVSLNDLRGMAPVQINGKTVLATSQW